jgi:integral membrane sensor domain MASE1
MVEMSGRRRKSDVGERSKSLIASHHPNTQREALLSSLVCCFSRLSAPLLSASHPRPTFPINILVEWFMYVVFLNLLFSATKTKQKSTR